jgi:hypothetical protein
VDLATKIMSSNELIAQEVPEDLLTVGRKLVFSD